MKKAAKTLAKDLISFIDNSPTAFHASAVLKERLKKAGFKELKEDESWSLTEGEGYFIERNNSAIAAFRMGKKAPWESGFRIAGAHTDSPALKVKPLSESVQKGMAKVGVEVYGGPIVGTWLDRDLSIAGRVMVKNGDEMKSVLVDFKKPVATVPNLAIHMNREVNKGFEYNKQTHLPAILGAAKEDEKEILKGMMAKQLDVDPSDIGEYDLYLYDVQPGTLLGRDEEYVCIGRIDNLAMCHSVVQALIDSKPSDATQIGMFFDNEEIGSRTLQGADSTFTRGLLERIVAVEGGKGDDIFRAIAKSFLVSADGAHAFHPNFPDKHDAGYAPVLNGGPVIKISANYRYATTAESASVFEEMCKKHDIPCQKMINRSDMPSGSTIGPMSSAHLSMKAVDVGNPMLAMHSVRETAGVMDHYYMTKVITSFFG